MKWSIFFFLEVQWNCVREGDVRSLILGQKKEEAVYTKIPNLFV